MPHTYPVIVIRANGSSYCTVIDTGDEQGECGTWYPHHFGICDGEVILCSEAEFEAYESQWLN